MSTWKQEVAAETVAIDGVNRLTAKIIWNLQVESDRGSAIIPRTETKISGSLAVKGPRAVDQRLIDGINCLSGDMVTTAAYLNYLELWKQYESSLSASRPLGNHWGIKPGVDELKINSESWKIIRISAAGMMDDEESGEAVPSKLYFYLRK